MFEANQILQHRYQLQRQLGRTATGHQTWLAIDIQNREQVTIKLLAFSPQMAWEELKLFEREAQILKALNHPYIPKYRDYFDLDKAIGDGIPWFALVQDYIPGFSLQELLERGQRFTETKIRQVAEETLDILIYLHELNPSVLHRDLKPSNLILGEDDRIYLIDFGSVQAQAAVTGVTFTVVGTSGYAPLEQFWGRAVAASDLYALGATLIHLLTGISPADLPHKESKIQFRDRVTVKSDLIYWLEKITELPVEKRFSSATEAKKKLISGTFRYQEDGLKLLSRTKPGLTKPLDSLIELSQKNEELYIKIPAGGLARLNEIFNAGCTGLIGYYIFFSIVPVLAYVAPPISLTIVIFMMTKIGLLLGTKTDVRLTKNTFQMRNNFWGMQYATKACLTDDILNIFLQRTGSIFQVNIRGTHRIYNLGGALSQGEATWLAHEIQNWIKLS
ncbi:MAG: serine/threonine protein kinase [Pleurocapsa sp.]